MKINLKIALCLLAAVFLGANLSLVYSQEGSEISPEDKSAALPQEEGTVLPEEIKVVLPEEREDALAQEKSDVLTKEIQGEIVSVDLDNSTLVIKHLTDEKAQTYENITVSVDNTTAVERNYENTTLADLKAGEEVTVGYTTDAQGKSVVGYIGVKIKEKENKE
jgi:hypothetical protein